MIGTSVMKDLNFFVTLSWRNPYRIETSPLVCSANQRTGFCIRTSVMRKLKQRKSFLKNQPRKSKKIRAYYKSTILIVKTNYWQKYHKSKFINSSTYKSLSSEKLPEFRDLGRCLGASFAHDSPMICQHKN